MIDIENIIYIIDINIKVPLQCHNIIHYTLNWGIKIYT